jgi:hypothetical protein
MADRASIEAVIKQLESRSGLPAGAASDVRAAVEGSPYLAEVMSTAIERGGLRAIRISNDANEGGHFDRETGSIVINESTFRGYSAEVKLDVLTEVMGHETGHALMADSADHATTKFTYRVEQAIREARQNGEPSVNVTPYGQELVAEFRKNEGLAALIGMNALVSRVTKLNDGVFNEQAFITHANMASECVNEGKLAEGIVLGENGIQATHGSINGPAVEAVAVCHFDKSAPTLGLKGTSSYDEYYGAYTIGATARIWKENAGGSQAMPLIEIDLDAMKLSKHKIEDAGVELGGPGKGFDIVDISHGQRQMVGLQQSDIGKSKFQPDILPDHHRLLADNPSHPDHDRFSCIHEWVKGTGQWDEEKSKNVASSLYREQAADPLMKRVDKVMGGLGQDGAQNVFAAYTPFGDKAPFFLARVDGRQAAEQPAQQSLEQAEQVKQQIQFQQMEQQQQRDQVAQRGPSMTL